MQEHLFEVMFQNNQEFLKGFSKYLAIVIRNEIEDFHVEHLSDKQMAQLNPLIRKAIYNGLFAFSNAHKSDFCAKWADYNLKTIPPYWEEPELIPEFEEIKDKIAIPLDIGFQSQFLNDQLQIGNILLDSAAQCVRIIGSYAFNNVSGNTHSHRDKISKQLKKEGFEYNFTLGAYIKKIAW